MNHQRTKLGLHEKPWYVAEDVAKRIGVTGPTVIRMARRGELPPSDVPTRRPRWRRETIEQWLKQGTQP